MTEPKKEYIERNELIAKLSEIPALKEKPNLMTLCKELANSISAADVIPRKNLEDKLSYLKTRCVKGVEKYFDKGMYGALKIVSVREKSFPTADMRQATQGEWKKSRDGICCSICGADAMINVLEHGERWYSGNYLLTNFCPNCGADMSGGNNA